MKVLEIKASRVSESEEFPGGEALQVHTSDTRSDVSDQRVDVWESSAPRLCRNTREGFPEKTSHWNLKDVRNKGSGHFREQDQEVQRARDEEQRVVTAEVKDEDRKNCKNGLERR